MPFTHLLHWHFSSPKHFCSRVKQLFWPTGGLCSAEGKRWLWPGKKFDGHMTEDTFFQSLLKSHHQSTLQLSRSLLLWSFGGCHAHALQKANLRRHGFPWNASLSCILRGRDKKAKASFRLHELLERGQTGASIDLLLIKSNIDYARNESKCDQIISLKSNFVPAELRETMSSLTSPKWSASHPDTCFSSQTNQPMCWSGDNWAKKASCSVQKNLHEKGCPFWCNSHKHSGADSATYHNSFCWWQVRSEFHFSRSST